MIITIPDQLVLIKSHVAAIERAMRTSNYEAIATFFEGIENAAKAGKDYAAGMQSPDEQTNNTPT